MATGSAQGQRRTSMSASPRFAQEKSIDALTFLRGIPGTIGGALRMNAGAYGGETKDVLVEARAVDRTGNIHVLSNAD
jgi:UDP-N-acetylmuramate dehydrogenase